MTKERLKLIFHGREMNLLEAKLYLFGLEYGLSNAHINPDEETDYAKWKEIRDNRNILSQKLVKENTYKSSTERDYLVEKLENKLKSAKNKDYCKANKHKKSFTGTNGTIVYDVCERCGLIYHEEAISEQENNSKQAINNPFRG